MVTPKEKKDSLLACLQSPVIFQKTSEPYLYFVNKSFKMNLDVKARINLLKVKFTGLDNHKLTH